MSELRKLFRLNEHRRSFIQRILFTKVIVLKNTIISFLFVFKVLLNPLTGITNKDFYLLSNLIKSCS